MKPGVRRIRADMPQRIAAEEKDEWKGICLAVWSQWPINQEKKSPSRNTNFFFFSNAFEYFNMEKNDLTTNTSDGR